MSSSTPAASGGCLKYGCIVALLIAVLLGGGLYFYITYSIRNAVEAYTQPAAIVVSGPTVPDDVRKMAAEEALNSAIALRAALNAPSQKEGALAGSSTTTGRVFRFTALQLEELLRSALPTLFPIGSFIVQGNGDELTAKFSLSGSVLASLWGAFSTFAPVGEDRFFNGEVTFGGSILAGRPKLVIKELSLAGTTLPEMGRTSAAASAEGFLKALFAGEVETKQPIDYSRIQEARISEGGVLIAIKP